MSAAAPLSGTSLGAGEDRAGRDQAALARPPALPWHKASICHPMQPQLGPRAPGAHPGLGTSSISATRPGFVSAHTASA